MMTPNQYEIEFFNSLEYNVYEGSKEDELEKQGITNNLTESKILTNYFQISNDSPVDNEFIDNDESKIQNELKEEKYKNENQSTNTDTQNSNSQNKSNLTFEDVNQNPQEQKSHDEYVNKKKRKKRAPAKKSNKGKNPNPNPTRKYDRDSLFKKLFSAIIKFFIVFYNDKYAKNNIQQSLKNIGKLDFKGVGNFMETIKDQKLKVLLSKGISKKYKKKGDDDDEDYNKKRIGKMKDELKPLFELTFDDVCQYLSRCKENPEAFQDEKFQKLRGFEEKLEENILAKITNDEKELKLCLELMRNHLQFEKKKKYI